MDHSVKIKNSWAEKILFWLLAATLVIPLIYGVNLFQSVIVVKTLVFTSLVEVSALLYLWLWIHNKSYGFKFLAIDWAMLAFFVILLLSTIFGANPFVSLWGTMARMTGLFFWGHILIYYYLLRGSLRSQADWSFFLKGTILVGALSAIYVLIQHFFDFGWLMPKLDEGRRATGLMGNPIFSSAFLMASTLLAWNFIWSNWSKSWKIISLISFVLGISAIILLGARGPLLGFGLGWLILSLGSIWQSRHKWLRIASSVVLGLLILSGSLIFIYRSTEFVKGLPTIGRLVQISSSTSDASTYARLATWDIAWESFKERPLLGYGLENFSIAMTKNYVPVFEDFGAAAGKFDKAHSFVFEYLATTGFIGLLAYLAIFFLGFLSLHKLWKKVSGDNRRLVLLVGSLLLAYLVQGITSIETIAPLTTIILLMALIAFWVQSDQQRPADSARDSKIWPVAWWGMLGLVIYSLAQYHFLPLTTNYSLMKANHEASQGNFNQATILAEASLGSVNYMRPDAVLAFAAQTDENVAYSSQGEPATDYLEKSASWVNEYVLPYRKGEVSPLTVLGGIYSKLISSGVDGYREKSEEIFNQAVELSPKRALTWMEWGKASLIIGNYEEASAKFSEAININDRFGEAYALRSISRLYTRDLTGGREDIDKAFEIYPAILLSPAYYGLIVNAYVWNNQSNSAVEFSRRLLDQYPEAGTIRARLAALLKSLGRIYEARIEAEYVLEHSINPSSRQAAQEFLDTL